MIKNATRLAIVALSGVMATGLASAASLTYTTSGLTSTSALTFTGATTTTVESSPFNPNTFFLSNLGELGIVASTTPMNLSGSTLDISINIPGVGTGSTIGTFANGSYSGMASTGGGRITFDNPVIVGNYSFIIDPQSITSGQSNFLSGRATVQAVPEPFTMTLGAACFGVALRRRVARKK